MSNDQCDVEDTPFAHPLVVRVVKNGMDDLDTIIVENDFVDDHEICLNLIFKFKDGTSYEVSFWWIDAQFVLTIGAAMVGSKSHLKEVEDYIKQYNNDDIVYEPEYYMNGYKTP